jgi:hypothetical protein
MKLPAFPPLSRQLPPIVARSIVASTCKGGLPGGTTIKPKPIVPSGLGNAEPIAEARFPALHRSSKPASV